MRYVRGILIAVMVMAAGPLSSLAAPSDGGDKEHGSRSLPISELLALRLSVAESTYQGRPTARSKGELLEIYEKVTGLVCMPNLHRIFQYEGAPTHPHCVEFIKKTLNLDPGNPVALCAREGMESSVCRSAFKVQVLETFSPSSEERMEIATLDEVLAQRRNAPIIAKETNQLTDELQRLIRISVKKRTESDLASLRRIYSRLLDLHCQDSRVRVRESDEEVLEEFERQQHREEADSGEGKELLGPMVDETPQAAPTPDAATSSDPFLNDPLLRSLTEEIDRSAQLPHLPKSNRVYQISSSCSAYLEKALQFDPKFAPALCHHNGFYSPVCIDALRTQEKKSQSAPSPHHTTPANAGGFETF